MITSVTNTILTVVLVHRIRFPLKVVGKQVPSPYAFKDFLAIM